jgi:hypothetical protein
MRVYNGGVWEGEGCVQVVEEDVAARPAAEHEHLVAHERGGVHGAGRGSHSRLARCRPAAQGDKWMRKEPPPDQSMSRGVKMLK